MKKFLCLSVLVVFLLSSFGINAQTYYQITNFNGTQTYGGVGVTVTSTGSVAQGGGQCFGTGLQGLPAGFTNTPYWAGAGGPGQYNYAFSQPVGTIQIFCEGLNTGEIVEVYINGVLYCINPCNVVCGYSILCGGGGNLGFQQNCQYHGPNNQYGGGEMVFPGGNITSFGLWCDGSLAGTDYFIFFSPTVNPNSNCSGCFSAHNNGPICEGGTLKLWCDTLVNATSYAWYGPNGFTANTQYVTIPNVTPAAAGVYTVVGTIPGGHDTAYTTVVITPNNNPGFSISPNPGCVGGPVTITGLPTTPASPPADYNWVATGGTTATATGVQTFTTSYLSPGMKDIILNFTNGTCVFADTQQVEIDPPFTLQVSSNSPVCQESDLHLSSTFIQDGVYAWTGPNGFTSTDQNPIITNVDFPQEGEYELLVTQTTNGCYAGDSTNVIILPLPAVPVVTNNGPLCIGGVLNLTSASDSGSLYSWTGPNGFTSTQEDVSILQFRKENAGEYYVTANLQGCKTIDSTQVQIEDPSFIILSDTTVCLHDSAKFSYQGPFGIGLTTVYNWTVPHAAVQTSGGGQSIYVVFDSIGIQPVVLSVTDSGTQCYDITATKDIYVAAPPVTDISVPTDACANAGTPILVSYVTNDVNKYAWDFGGGNVLSGSDKGPYLVSWGGSTAAQHISLTVTSIYGCSASTAADILVHPLPAAIIRTQPPTGLCAGDSLRLEADQYDMGNKYVWGPEKYFQHGNTGGTVYATMSSSSEIDLTVTDAYGCSETAQTYINTQPCCQVSFPNAFTPNAPSGRNTIFRPITIGNHSIKEFIIVNRWGQTVFRSGEEKAGWDGTLNGVPMDIGTYNWYIKYECNGKLMEEKGDVTLIR